MALTPDDILKHLQAALSATRVIAEGQALIVPVDEILAVAKYLRDTSPYVCDYLSNLTATDYPDRNEIEVVYHLYSMAKKHGPIALKVRLPRATLPPVATPEAGSQSDPGRLCRPATGGGDNPTMPSVTPLWRGAEFQEREVYDLYGVTFTGHPDLRRILMWDEFAGHPMRKDYVDEDQDIL